MKSEVRMNRNFFWKGENFLFAKRNTYNGACLFHTHMPTSGPVKRVNSRQEKILLTRAFTAGPQFC